MSHAYRYLTTAGLTLAVALAFSTLGRAGDDPTSPSYQTPDQKRPHHDAIESKKTTGEWQYHDPNDPLDPQNYKANPTAKKHLSQAMQNRFSMDKDGDGKITKDEWMRYHEAMWERLDHEHKGWIPSTGKVNPLDPRYQR